MESIWIEYIYSSRFDINKATSPRCSDVTNAYFKWNPQQLIMAIIIRSIYEYIFFVCFFSLSNFASLSDQWFSSQNNKIVDTSIQSWPLVTKVDHRDYSFSLDSAYSIIRSLLFRLLKDQSILRKKVFLRNFFSPFSKPQVILIIIQTKPSAYWISKYLICTICCIFFFYKMIQMIEVALYVAHFVWTCLLFLLLFWNSGWSSCQMIRSTERLIWNMILWENFDDKRKVEHFILLSIERNANKKHEYQCKNSLFVFIFLFQSFHLFLSNWFIWIGLTLCVLFLSSIITSTPPIFVRRV